MPYMSTEFLSSGPNKNESVEGHPSQYVTYLREHGFPQLNDLQLSMFFGAHGTAADANDITLQLKSMGADVFIPELLGFKPEREKLIRDISLGRASPDATSFAGSDAVFFLEQLMRNLHNTRVNVGFAEAPAGGEDARTFLEADSRYTNFPKEIKPLWSWKDAQSIFAERVKRFAESFIVRERYIAKHICPAIVRAYADDQSRATIKSLKVMMSIGNGHEQLHDLIRSMHPQTIKIAQGQLSRMYLDEAVRQVMSGNPIPKELQGFLITENLITALTRPGLRKLGLTSAQMINFVYHCTSKMSPDEQRTLYTLHKQKTAIPAGGWLQKNLLEKGLIRSE